MFSGTKISLPLFGWVFLVIWVGQVTKAVIVEAVREGVSAEAAAQLADLKKPAMAEAAERLLADKGWLPQVLRLPQAALAA
ncbi:hypothetical protein XH99_11105 [Bradyrhizobium nanningense]|uniref:Uncharacterized protein n=1 Tax=Bradyrhizobium nanningense TaxID=1325118 RepID=A0A4V1L2E7_9BRAD|nr:hypothetical protein XH99_11105 [Bradyrhizobium nanningense]